MCTFNFLLHSPSPSIIVSISSTAWEELWGGVLKSCTVAAGRGPGRGPDTRGLQRCPGGHWALESSSNAFPELLESYTPSPGQPAELATVHSPSFPGWGGGGLTCSSKCGSSENYTLEADRRGICMGRTQCMQIAKDHGLAWHLRFHHTPLGMDSSCLKSLNVALILHLPETLGVVMEEVVQALWSHILTVKTEARRERCRRPTEAGRLVGLLQSHLSAMVHGTWKLVVGWQQGVDHQKW